MEVVPPAPPLDAEMAEDADAMASQAAIDSMEYDEEAPRYDGDVEINDAHPEHDDARSTEMGEEDARDYATLANAAALQQEFATSSSSSMAAAAPMDGALVEAPMLPAPSSDGMQASQVDEHLETEAGYEPVEADAPAEQQRAQIVEAQDEATDAKPVAQPQPGQAGDTAQEEEAAEPSTVNTNADEHSTSALAAATSTGTDQHDEAQAEPEASAEERATSSQDDQANGQASATAAAEQQARGSEANHDHVAESSTAAIHPADAPQVKEGNNDDSTAAHNAGASTYSPSSANTTPPPTLRLSFEEESFVLFPSSSESSQYLAYPSDGTDGPIESVDAIPLSVPTEVYWEPLEALFRGLRVKEALGEFLEGGTGSGKETAHAAAVGSVGSDLVLRLPDLGLVVREDSVYTREVRLVDLVRLHEGLGAQSSLHIEVSEDDSFLHELRGLQEHVKESEHAGALGQESHDDEEGVETGEATLDGQVEEVASADAQHDAQHDEAGADAAEQTFVTVGEGHEDDDQDDDTAEQQAAGEDSEEPGDEDEAGQAEAQHTGEDNDDDDADAQAEAEAEAEVEEPSYEPVEDGEADAETEDAAEEQAEGEEKLVEYEEEEEGAADDEEDEQHEEGAEQYEEEGANDDDGEEEEDGEEQQDEAEEGEGDYPEEPDAEAEEVAEGYDEEEEAVDGHDDAQHDEFAAAGEEEVNGNGAVAPEAPARLGKRSFDGEDELDGDDNDAPHGESGVEAKKVKASH